MRLSANSEDAAFLSESPRPYTFRSAEHDKGCCQGDGLIGLVYQSWMGLCANAFQVELPSYQHLPSASWSLV